GFAKVLPRVQSDHHLIIILTEGEPNVGRNRHFRFEAAWSAHENFHQFLQDNWVRGDWIEDQEDLCSMVRNFYLNLYREENPIRDPIISWTTYPQTLEVEQDRLSGPLHFSECKRALFEMGPHKAPGVV
ncbi:hypothetical protein L195_g045438, partial [Trifolium pratense]